MLPPASRIRPITPAERKAVMAESPAKGVYDRAIDRESAYEKLAGRASAAAGGALGSLLGRKRGPRHPGGGHSGGG